MEVNAPAHQSPRYAPPQEMFKVGMLLLEDIKHRLGMVGAEWESLQDAAPEIRIRQRHSRRKCSWKLRHDEAVKRKRRYSEQ